MSRKTVLPKGGGSVFPVKGGFKYQYKDIAGAVRSKILYDKNGLKIIDKDEAERKAVEHYNARMKEENFHTKAQAIVRIAEAKKLLSRSGIKIEGIWDCYLANPTRPDSAEGTLLFYRRALDIFIPWLNSNYPNISEIDDITEKEAHKFAEDYWKKGISERTYNARITSLKLIFKTLLNDDNPFKNIRHKTENKQSRLAFTVEQLRSIWKTMDDPSYHMINKAEMRMLMMMMLYSGCRGEDACLMRWSNIDMEKRILTYIPLKTARKRPVPVSIPIADSLFSILSEKYSAEVQPDDYIIPAVADRYQRNQVGISLDITRLLEKAEIKTKEKPTGNRQKAIVRYSMHSFRHTFCTLTINQSIPISVIQSIVGHSTADMTSHYSHISMESKQKAINVLPAIEETSDNKKYTAQSLKKLKKDDLIKIILELQ